MEKGRQVDQAAHRYTGSLCKENTQYLRSGGVVVRQTAGGPRVSETLVGSIGSAGEARLRPHQSLQRSRQHSSFIYTASQPASQTIDRLTDREGWLLQASQFVSSFMCVVSSLVRSLLQHCPSRRASRSRQDKTRRARTSQTSARLVLARFRR